MTSDLCGQTSPHTMLSLQMFMCQATHASRRHIPGGREPLEGVKLR